MTRNDRRRIAAAVAVTVATILGGPLFAGSGAAAASGAGAGAASWAFGAHTNSTASGTGSGGGYVYAFHAFFGWDTVLTQTNTSAATFQLEVQRTMATDFSVSECRPTCAAPLGNLSIGFHAWETTTGFGNFTSAGTVFEGGTAVPAYAIADGSYSVRANVTAWGNSTYHGMLNLLHATYYSSVAAQAHSSVTFDPALGLYPTSPQVGATWNASSAYLSNGAWAWSYSIAQVRMNGLAAHYANNSSGSLAGHGNVSISGGDDGTLGLDGGLLTHAVRLATDADFPFHLHDGVLFVPAPTDVFGASGQGWQAPQPGNATAATAGLNVGPSPGGHFSLYASAMSYAPSSTSTAPSSTTALTSADGPAPTTVQAQPEAVGTAQQNMNCLTAGTCSGQGTPTGGPSGFVRILVIGLVVLAGVGAVAAVIARRREVPPPSHPNARLYPPTEGGRSPSAPTPAVPAARGPTGARPPVEGEPDPLGHLW